MLDLRILPKISTGTMLEPPLNVEKGLTGVRLRAVTEELSQARAERGAISWCGAETSGALKSPRSVVKASSSGLQEPPRSAGCRAKHQSNGRVPGGGVGRGWPSAILG
jgi:hypothetical protein